MTAPRPNIRVEPWLGQAAVQHLAAVAALRIRVFYEYPYLYDGNLAYEKKYLNTYASSPRALIVLCWADEKIVGASTGIPMIDEEPAFAEPFHQRGFNPNKIFYFGESVLLPEYRGLGIGKAFMRERERYALSLPDIDTTCFCAVVREANHSLKPQDYRPLDTFWQAEGYRPEPGLVTEYTWLDRHAAAPTAKKMQFWLKNHKII